MRILGATGTPRTSHAAGCLRTPAGIVKRCPPLKLTAELQKPSVKEAWDRTKKNHTALAVWFSQRERIRSLDLFRNRNGFRQSKIRLGLRRQDLGDGRLWWQLRRCWHRGSLDLHFLVTVHACAGRDEVTDDDVLLESKQLVPRAANCSVGEN